MWGRIDIYYLGQYEGCILVIICFVQINGIFFDKDVGYIHIYTHIFHVSIYIKYCPNIQFTAFINECNILHLFL